jgi:hypothetical protein
MYCYSIPDMFQTKFITTTIILLSYVKASLISYLPRSGASVIVIFSLSFIEGCSLSNFSFPFFLHSITAAQSWANTVMSFFDYYYSFLTGVVVLKPYFFQLCIPSTVILLKYALLKCIASLQKYL